MDEPSDRLPSTERQSGRRAPAAGALWQQLFLARVRAHVSGRLHGHRFPPRGRLRGRAPARALGPLRAHRARDPARRRRPLCAGAGARRRLERARGGAGTADQARRLRGARRDETGRARALARLVQGRPDRVRDPNPAAAFLARLPRPARARRRPRRGSGGRAPARQRRTHRLSDDGRDRNLARPSRLRLPRRSLATQAAARVALVLPRACRGGAALGRRADLRMGDDRGRPSTLGRLSGDAHLRRRHRRRRHSSRLRDARACLPRPRTRGRLDPPPARPRSAERSTHGQGGVSVHLYELPLLFALIGLAFYTVLAGADFGAGWWQLTAGNGPDADSIRDHAHQAMGPVWEANHVWLIFVLTVVWTAYPKAFGSIASTLCVALLIAAIGIIFRGAAYALRSGASSLAEQTTIDTAFGISSVIVPFALGAAVGGIASGRVPVGNAAGDLFTSWLNPTSILIGVLAVVTGAYLAAVAVAAIVAGWALAQSPHFLPGLTVRQAAAPHDALVAILVAILAGGALLVPALGTLFRLTLRGHLDHAEAEQAPPPRREARFGEPRHPQLLLRVAAALLIAGFGFTNVADAQWAHVLGAACLLGVVATGFRVALPAL